MAPSEPPRPQAPKPAPPPPSPAATPPPALAPLRWWESLGLILLTALLLTLAFAPFYQFYLAWIALVPWLWVLHKTPGTTRAILWSWLCGILFFSANMWWMGAINIAGMIALMIYCGFYWACTALLIRGGRMLQLPPLIAVPAIAALWIAAEFIRGIVFTGLPWLFIGHSQSPILAMCQIADTFGAYGVSFWVVMVNVLITLCLLRRTTKAPFKPLIPAAALTLTLLAAALGYGLWRMDEATTTPGPEILVVQSNYPQSNSGEKGASDEELIHFHVDATRKAVDAAGVGLVNLAVWSETMMPPLNHENLIPLVDNSHYGQMIHLALNQLSQLAESSHIGLLVGARYTDQWSTVTRDGGTYLANAISRNSAYLFQPDGRIDDRRGARYDKIHLVPFGEFIPFKVSFPPLYKLFLKLGPKYYVDYQLQDGMDNGLTVFKLKDADGTPRWKFVTPICFEDIDAVLCASMFRPGPDGQKRAEFLVNITNDGWFAGGENKQHLQAALFRSIENRVPTARSVNTGVSGFIDSVGRQSGLLPPRTDGASVGQLMLDSRLSAYTLYGDWFAWLCVLFSGAAAVESLGRWLNKDG